MIIEYALVLVLGVLGVYLLAPPATATASLVVCLVCAVFCACAVFLIWRLFRDK